MNSPELQEEPSPSVTQAEQAVNTSLANFETAIERLSDKVDTGIVPLIQHVRSHTKIYLTVGALLGAGMIYFYAVTREPASN